MKERSGLIKKLAAVDSAIARHGGSASGETVAPVRRGRGRPKGSTNANAGRGRRRVAVRAKGKSKGTGRPGRKPKNGAPLQGVIHGVLKGKSMNVKDITKAVLDTGFKTSSKHFQNMVGQMIYKHGTMFKKVSPGVYTTK
jgi:hypothetical protein